MSIGTAVFNPKMLIPHCSQKIIRRERLIDLLHDNVETSVQVLVAPAGYGKTTLLAEFIQDLNAPVCWYSLEAADEDPRILLEGILSSISSRFPGFGQLSLTRLNNTNDLMKDAVQVVNTVAAEIRSEITDFFIIVLDDFHFIHDNRSANNLLNLFIERLPENCHVIISSRAPVELPVVLKNLLQHPSAMITGSQLGLTSTETKDLVTLRYGINLSVQDADKLTQHTGGWMLGVLSSVHSLNKNKNSKLNGFSQDEIYSYLTTEVFEKQPIVVQAFLLASSTLDDLTPEFCDQLLSTTSSRKILRQLSRQNLFMQCIDETKRWYRYHQVFKDFLQAKLLEDDPRRFLEIQGLTGSVYEKDKQWDLAIKHYAIAKKYNEIVGILKKVGQDFFKSGKWTTISKWLDALPQELRETDSELIILDAQARAYLGKSDEAVHLLSGLIKRLDGENDWLLKGEALSWRGAAFRLNGYYEEAQADIGSSIQLLEQHPSPPELLGVAHRRLGDIHAEQGRFSLALEHFQRALKYFTAVMDVSEIARAHNSLGITHKRLGNLPKAKMHFEKARAGWLKTNNFGALSVVLNNIGIIYQRIGQYDLALDTLRSGLEKARETGYRRVEAGTLISIADILRDLGEYQNALSAYQEGQEIARQVMESSLVAYATSGIGETYRLQGERDKADILLKEAFHQAQDQQQPYEAALFSIPIGIIEYERGRFEKAENILLDASQRLETIGDKDALARGYFHLAQSSFLLKKYDTAIKWLEKTSCLADELGYEDFLVIEGRNAIPLVQYGSAKAVGGTRFSEVLEKINSTRERKSITNSTVGFSSGPELNRRSDIEVNTLGQSSVKINNRQLDDTDWRSQRAKEIFFYLLTYQSGRTREQIAADLWPDLSPSKASSNFHINLFRARQALYPGIFVFENACYRVNPNLHISFDALEFERLLDGIDTPGHLIGSLSNVEEAIGLYSGAFLTELNGEWIEVRRRELENKYIKALSLLVDHYEKKGEYSKATAFLEKLIAIDPYDEDVYYSIMRFQIAEKNSPMALYAYKRYAEIVNSSVEPGIPADIRELQQRILASTPLIHQQN